MSTSFTFEVGVLITLATIVFSAGSFYMMGVFNGKKLDKVLGDIESVKDSVHQIKNDMVRIDERMKTLERQANEKNM